MNGTESTPWLTRVALAIWLVAEFAVALTLRVEGYDGYWYLSNAWHLAGGEVSVYETTKAPLVSLLLVPLFWLRRLGVPELAAFIGAHLVQVGLTFACGLLLARQLRRLVPADVARAAVFAFLASRVVFRYGAFVMADLPATLMVLGTLEAVQRDTRRDGLRGRLSYVLWGAAAVLARYPSAMLLPLASLWDVIQAGLRERSARTALHRLGAHGAAAVLLTALVVAAHLVIYAVPFGGPSASFDALVDMVDRNVRLGGISVRGFEPWWEYGPGLLLGCTAAVCGLMLVGAGRALRDPGQGVGLHAAWAALHLLFISGVSSHKEARYLLPALPSLYVLAVAGMRVLGDLARQRAPQWARAGRTLAVAFFLAAGAYTLATEARRLAQPFFRTPGPARISAWIADRTPGTIWWAGNFYPRVPPRHLFDPRDEYYYVYHLGPHVLEYHTGRPVRPLRGLELTRVDGVLLPLGGALVIREGDSIVSSVAEVTVTSRLPDPPVPLYLSTLKEWNLSPRGEGSFVGPVEGVSARISGSELRLQGFPGPSEVVVRLRQGNASLGLVSMRDGSARLPLRQIDPLEVRGVRVVRYRPVPVPGTGP